MPRAWELVDVRIVFIVFAALVTALALRHPIACPAVNPAPAAPTSQAPRTDRVNSAIGRSC